MFAISACVDGCKRVSTCTYQQTKMIDAVVESVVQRLVHMYITGEGDELDSIIDTLSTQIFTGEHHSSFTQEIQAVT